MILISGGLEKINIIGTPNTLQGRSVDCVDTDHHTL
jgi:hypothetical protein